MSIIEGKFLLMNNLTVSQLSRKFKKFKLCDVCRFKNGFAFKSNLFKPSGEPILRITNIDNLSINSNSLVYFNKSDYKEDLSSYVVKKDDVVIAMSGATTGKVGWNYSSKVYYLNQRVGRFDPDEKLLNKRYLYHWLTSKENEIIRLALGSGAQPNLSSNSLMNLEIDLPSLEVQDEIVHILDNFVELTSELTAELSLRKSQYDFYLNYLLNFETKAGGVQNNWIFKEIKFLFKRIKGTSITAEEMKIIGNKRGDIKIFAGGKTQTFVDKSFSTKLNVCNEPSVIVQSRGLIDFIYYDEPFTFKNEMWAYTSENPITTKYLYYLLKKDLFYFRKASLGMGAMPQISLSVTENFKVLIPDLIIQKKIVDMLDKFSTYNECFTTGLPAEIELRKKQYAYYRDKLLSFNY